MNLMRTETHNGLKSTGECLFGGYIGVKKIGHGERLFTFSHLARNPHAGDINALMLIGRRWSTCLKCGCHLMDMGRIHTNQDHGCGGGHIDLNTMGNTIEYIVTQSQFKIETSLMDTTSIPNATEFQ